MKKSAVVALFLLETVTPTAKAVEAKVHLPSSVRQPQFVHNRINMLILLTLKKIN